LSNTKLKKDVLIFVRKTYCQLKISILASAKTACNSASASETADAGNLTLVNKRLLFRSPKQVRRAWIDAFCETFEAGAEGRYDAQDQAGPNWYYWEEEEERLAECKSWSAYSPAKSHGVGARFKGGLVG
jgi:hypothetical protein